MYVDPDDSTNLLAADAGWAVGWYEYPLFVLAGLFAADLFFFLFLG